jgi:hypothetical protein
MIKASHVAELDELLGRLLDGATLEPDQESRLQTLLQESPELLDQFIITTALANDLHHSAALAVCADGESEQIDRSHHWTASSSLSYGLGISFLALAASAAFIALPTWRIGQGAAERPIASEMRAEFVATVVSQEGWVDSAIYPTGSRIPTGVFEIEHGVVQLQLDSGPNLLLEGPASLEIKSVSQAHLAFGKLVFHDESGSDPFYLSTPSSKLTDLGTEYAVAVSGDDEEVHVFSGAVERTGAASQDRSSVELLSDGQAMRYRRNAPDATEPLASAPQKFVRKVDVSSNLPAQYRTVYEPFNYRNKSATKQVRANGGVGWRGPWRINTPDNPGQARHDLTRRVGDSLVFGANSDASRGGAVGYVGKWLMHRDLAESIDLAANRVVYVSFLYRPAGMWKQGDNGLKLLFYNPNEGVIEHRIAIALDATRGLIRGALCGARKECPLPMADGSTYLIVAKIACSTDNPDQLMLRIFQPQEPIGLGEPSIWTIVTPPIDSDDSFRLMSLQFNCEQEQRIDEIRMGSTWESVTSPWSMKADLTHLEIDVPIGG